MTGRISRKNWKNENFTVWMVFAKISMIFQRSWNKQWRYSMRWNSTQLVTLLKCWVIYFFKAFFLNEKYFQTQNWSFLWIFCGWNCWYVGVWFEVYWVVKMINILIHCCLLKSYRNYISEYCSKSIYKDVLNRILGTIVFKYQQPLVF